jgi:pilus assembly protein TadC
MIKSKKQGKFMNCPNCNEEVELTTKRYFGSLFGKYICPKCSTKFKLKRTKRYFLWIFLSIVFVVFSSLFIINFVTNKEVLDITYMVYLVILFFVYCFIDRKIENSLPTKAI